MKGFFRVWSQCCSSFYRGSIKRLSQENKKIGTDRSKPNRISLRDLCELLLNVRNSLPSNLRVLCVSVVNFALVAFASADGPITLWYQRGGNPDQQRIMQKDLVAPFNAAHPNTPLTLDVLAGGTGDKKIRMAVVSGKGPDIVMTPGPSTTLALVQSGHLLPLVDYIKKYNLD